MQPIRPFRRILAARFASSIKGDLMMKKLSRVFVLVMLSWTLLPMSTSAHPIINSATLTPRPAAIPVGGFVNPINFNLSFSITNADAVAITISGYNFTLYDDDAGLTGFDDPLGSFGGAIAAPIPVGGTVVLALGPFLVPAATLNAAIDNLSEGSFLEPIAEGTLSWFQNVPPATPHDEGFSIPEPSTLLLLGANLAGLFVLEAGRLSKKKRGDHRRSLLPHSEGGLNV